MLIDCTPDWLVTKKNRGKIGVPISVWVVRTGELNGSSELRTEGFCFVSLIVLPQSVLQNRLGGEIVLHESFPKREAKFLVIVREERFPKLHVQNYSHSYCRRITPH